MAQSKLPFERELTQTALIQLQNLPFEIQLLILEAILVQRTPTGQRHPNVNVLLLSKALYARLAPRYYQASMFRIDSIPTVINDFLQNGSTGCLQNVKRLHVVAPGVPFHFHGHTLDQYATATESLVNAST